MKGFIAVMPQKITRYRCKYLKLVVMSCRDPKRCRKDNQLDPFYHIREIKSRKIVGYLIYVITSLLTKKKKKRHYYNREHSEQNMFPYSLP